MIISFIADGGVCVDKPGCVCRVMANDYLYTAVVGLELCVFGHSLVMT